MTMYVVIKRDGRQVQFDSSKIEIAILKAMRYGSGIVNVVVNEDMLDEKGRLEIEKAGLMAYAHGQYFELGKKIGSFGFSVRKPEKKAKKQPENRTAKRTASRPYVKKKTNKK